MKSVSKFSLFTALALGLSAGALRAADESSAQGAKFSGKVSSVDRSSQTVTVDGEKYQLLPTSRITKQDRSASASDLAEGQQVDGRYKRSAEDKLEVLTLDIAKDSDSAIGGTRDRTQRETGATFQGRLGKIDRANQTIRVGNHTYHILPTTTMTRGSGGTTTLSDLKQDQRVTGTYKESAEGRRELISIEVGRQNNKDRD